MKLFVLFFIISSQTWAQSQSPYARCQAPGQGFLEEKFRESFLTDAGEKELKEVVRDSKNYALREEIKSINRRTMVVGRIERSELVQEAEKKFQQMIELASRTEDIQNFPAQGAVSKVSAVNDSLAIEMNNLSKEDLDVLPPQILEKLSPKVTIYYHYPYDKFEYYLTYNERELPMNKAFLKIQNDFEESCVRNNLENSYDRKKNQNSYGGSSNQ